MNRVNAILTFAFAFSSVGLLITLFLAAGQILNLGIDLLSLARVSIVGSFIAFAAVLFYNHGRKLDTNTENSPTLLLVGLPGWFKFVFFTFGLIIVACGVALVLSPPQEHIDYNRTIQLLTSSLLYMVSAAGFWSILLHRTTTADKS